MRGTAAESTPRWIARRSLRRTVALGAVLGAVATLGALALSATAAHRQAMLIETETDALLLEQRIAEEIVAITYRQQLAANQYLQERDERYVRQLRALGDAANDRLRRYLFQPLSAPARLQVEQLREMHETFEVSTRRAVDLAREGQTAAARERLMELSQRAAALDSGMTTFAALRRSEQAAFRDQLARDNGRQRGAVVVWGLTLLAGILLLAAWLRARILGPLHEIADTAGRIGAGDAGARVPAQSLAEFGAVAEAFNAMADQVQSARETTELQNEELRETLSHLQDTQAELVQHEKLSAMGQMLAGLAHEINNPLAGILGTAQLLRAELAESSDAAARRLGDELARPLEHEALRVRELVHNLLVFSRRPTPEIAPVALAAATSTAVGLRSHAFALAGKTIAVDVPQRLHVLADTQRLQHVIVNLLNNALDAISPGGSGVRIAAAREDDGSVVVTVDDDGPGFADPRAALGDFYTTKAAGFGTGLGLSLVQRFMGEFGGRVEASNRAEGGARVTLHFRGAAEPAASAPVATVASGTGEWAVPTGASRRVLVVDDEPSLQEVQRRLLHRAGYAVVVTSSGAAAIELLQVGSVDAVVTDLRMPGAVDGLALLAWIAEHQPALSARTLLVTGDVGGVASSPVGMPAERTIAKPFARDEYLSRVQGLFEGS